MKKMVKIWLVLMVLVGFGGCDLKLSQEMGGEAIEQVERVVEVEVGEKIYKVEVDEEASVLELLERVGRENGFEVEIKEFSFGSMVEGIDGVMSSSEKAWIYYVDGKAGDVGAGEKMVGSGAKVRWGYEDVE
jgi:hypothetical protein